MSVGDGFGFCLNALCSKDESERHNLFVLRTEKVMAFVMKDIIKKRLAEIKQAENIIILHAVESGSRVCGFASQDSDYDVRFIYVCPKNYYLRLDKKRDVLEYPLTDILDISGWNFDKILKLLHASNPAFFEWSNSPIIYKTTDTFRQLLPLINDYFMAKSGLWHYLSMAKRNYREYLKGEMVKVKNTFMSSARYWLAVGFWNGAHRLPCFLQTWWKRS